MNTVVIFILAILSEVFATTCLKFSDGFTKLVPATLVVLGYGMSFYLLSISLKVIPLGLAYAIWSGVGIVLTVLIGYVIWHEPLDWGRGIGISLILVGIMVINLFSKASAH